MKNLINWLKLILLSVVILLPAFILAIPILIFKTSFNASDATALAINKFIDDFRQSVKK